MKKLLYFIALVLTINSCDVINPDEDIPAYLEIRDFEFSAGNFNGAKNAKIPLAFVYANQDLLGIYELPTTIPVIAAGETQILIDAGIEANGISTTPENYPFYQRFEITVDLTPGETTVIEPSTEYADFTRIVRYENFEGNFNTFNIDIDGDEGTELVNSDLDVFAGIQSGYIRLHDTARIASIGSEAISDLPGLGSRAFLEMNYKSDLTVAIGAIPYNINGVVIDEGNDQTRGFNPKSEWNKIYFDFSDTFQFFRSLPEFAYFRISITAIKSSDSSVENEEIFIDDLQLLWRK